MREFLAIALLLLAQAAPADAAVKNVTAAGFEVTHATAIAAPPLAVYRMLGDVAAWWNPEHTYSGDARNLSLTMRAGGCFCEKLKNGGSVQHMTVAFASPGEMLRLRGALGPLQGEGMEGALTFALKPADGGTEITLSFVTGGYLRAGTEKMAQAVDMVLGEQLARLKQRFEKKN